jgi:hypothetical protein
MGGQQIGHILPKHEPEKMAERLIKVFSDLSVQDHQLRHVAFFTVEKTSPIVLGRILRYNEELARHRKEMSRPIYNRRNYVQQNILY